MMASGEQRVGKLQWRSRRGMKEMDLILEAFIERQRKPLLDGAWPQFEAFLDEDDNHVWNWLQGKAVPERADYRTLLDCIRRA
jgi:antitoxin CptB